MPAVGIMASGVNVSTGPPGPGFKTNLGNNGNSTSGTTLAITTTAAIAVGDLVVVRWAADNLSATTPTGTITDSGSNTYTAHAYRGQNATGAAGVVGGIAVTKATAIVALGGTITLTLSGAVTAKAMYAESFTGFDNTLRSAVVLASGASTAASVVSGTVNSGDLVIGAVAAETRATPTFDADTLNGSWAQPINKPNATSGTDANCVTINGQHKVTTAAGAQTYDNTIVSTDWAAMVCVFQPTPVAPPISMTGGTVVDSGGFRNHFFYSSGTLTVVQGGTCQVLVVAGGGAGGAGYYIRRAGGGGAGGVRSISMNIVANQNVIIGGGGAAVQESTAGTNGTASSIGVESSTGGGGGGGAGAASYGKNGGCGGGCGSDDPSAPGTGVVGEGKNGYWRSQYGHCGGGGGAVVGSTGSANGAGEVPQGGAGMEWPTGSGNYYGGGGGAGDNGDGPCAGGVGGGGAGAGASAPAVSGAANTGGGGGGTSQSQYGAGAPSGAGGSGIVIVRYVYP